MNKNFADSRRPEYSVQINNGLAETSADGASLAFDKKYGIMFCAYMPGPPWTLRRIKRKNQFVVFPCITADKHTLCHNCRGKRYLLSKYFGTR